MNMLVCIPIIATLGIHTALFIMLVMTYKSWVFFFATRYVKFRQVLDLAIITQVLYVVRSLFSYLDLVFIANIFDVAICVIVNVFAFILYFTVRSGILSNGWHKHE